MDDDDKIAIIGLACRFPGAGSAAQYWANLRAGRETISRFRIDEVIAAGVDPALARNPDYVPARGVFTGGERFDCAYFGYSPAEAAGIDPQHRVFLESASMALDDAGIDPRRFAGPVGVFAGCDAPPPADETAYDDETSRQLGYDKDHLAPRVAYKLDLRGPAITVQAACATSLVATHLACQSLLGYECDAALAGGVALWLPETVGYLFQEGHILSPDGRCRPFDAAASGTVPGSGVGVVVLRRLTDAIRDGHRIIAVIRGSAVNNDGGEKIGYTAPAVAGQRDVIRAALARADVDPGDIGYVEAHGTGTRVGDPVELAALTAAFRDHTDRTGFCLLGSVKSNIGHANSAAGVAGLIKTAYMLERRELVPTLHVVRPNPELELDTSPFRLCIERGSWRAEGPLLAGVSSFGLGGVNAHAVLESAPRIRRSPDRGGPRLLALSAASPTALTQFRSDLAGHLAGDAGGPTVAGEVPAVPAGAVPPADPADGFPSLDETAWTLATGRPRHPHRLAVVAVDRDQAIAGLRADRQPARAGQPRVAYLFPGQGTLHPGSGRAAHANLPGFRRAFDAAGEVVQDRFAVDLTRVLDPGTPAEWFRDTVQQQLGLFVLGYALAEQFSDWGVEPSAMLGHSIGEYVAATRAGVWKLPDALALVRERAQAMRGSAPGRMIAVVTDDVDALLATAPGVVVAVAGPDHVVLAGAPGPIDGLRAHLVERGVVCRPLDTAHAFHSPAMDAAGETLTAAVSRSAPRPATLPFVSNLTGGWMDAAQVSDPGYWADQLRRPVLLKDGIGTLLGSSCEVFVELGPGDSMTGALRRHPAWDPGKLALTTLGRASEREWESLLRAFATCWERGVPVDEASWFTGPPPRRGALPPHPMLPTAPTRGGRRRQVPTPADGPTVEPGPALTSPTWTQTQSAGIGRHHRLAVAGPTDAAVRRVVDGLAAPGATITEIGDLSGKPPDDTEVLVVALPARMGSEVVDQLDRLVERTNAARTVVLGRRLLDVFGTEPVLPAAGALDAWVSYRSRVASDRPTYLLDVGIEPGPELPPAVRAEGGRFAWRGRRWWARLPAPVPVPVPVPVPIRGQRPEPTAWRDLGGLVVVADRATAADELAVGGTSVTALVTPGGPPVDPLRIVGSVSWPSARDTLSTRPDLAARLDAYATALAGRFVTDQARLAPGDRLPWATLAAGLAPTGGLLRFVDSILSMLVADGWLRRAGDEAVVAPDLVERIRAGTVAGESLSEVAGLRRLLAHCVTAYPDVFAGRREPVSVLYPDGEAEFLHALLSDNTVGIDDAEPCLDALTRSVRTYAVEHGGPVRILEVGSGQGTLTSRLLDDWPDAVSVDYHVTDVSPLIVRQARERCRAEGRTGVRFSVFDITRDPVGQGLVPGSYDVVVAYNVVHVAPSVREALAGLGRLLRPTGWLGLVELTRPARWTHLVWGLAPGWWDHADDLRHDSIHLTASGWRDALHDVGLTRTGVATWSDEADHVLLAAAPQDPAGRRFDEELTRQGAGNEDPVLVLAGGKSPSPVDTRRPVWVVTEDPPLATGWRGELARRSADPVAPNRWHVEVSVLDATTLAAIPALLTSGELPPVLRLTAGRPVPGTAGPTLSTAPVPASPDAADGTAAGRPDADRSAAERAAQGRLATGGRDTTETMLAGLWCDVLGVTEVGAADDFFLLGGDSLMAVHLTARIRNQAGLRIAVPEFVSDATFASLVRLAGAADPAERPDPESRARPGSRARPTNLIVFTESGTRPPLFFVAPGAGSSLVYRELARRVAVDRPCYGLETPGLHDAVAPMTRFEDIAAHHLDLVHRYCPDGPYLLAGWSVGATVAHEMAVQDGRRVDLVVGIDGHVGDAGTLRAGIETARYQAQVRLPWRLARGRLDRFLAAPEGGGPDFAGVFLANLHGMRRYRPGRAPGEAVVFATRLTSRRRRRLTERLAAHYGGGVTVLPASGRHWTVLDEVHLDELAGAIRGVLDQWVAADAAGAASG